MGNGLSGEPRISFKNLMCSIKSLQTGSGRMVLTIFPSV